MLGTAGIGYFYLRLDNPALPPVLSIGGLEHTRAQCGAA